uniref:Uncharacterized protein n=1 Tax=Solanum lycopersicum TaxID=4081 RepID=A0A3Q7HI32_SOLLC
MHRKLTMENGDGTNWKRIRAEDVICELKDDGDFDKHRLKILGFVLFALSKLYVIGIGISAYTGSGARVEGSLEYKRKKEVLADCDMTYEACISGAGASCLGEKRCRGRLELRFDL